MAFTYTPVISDFAPNGNLSGCGRFILPNTTGQLISTLVLDAGDIKSQDFDESGNEVLLPHQVFSNTRDWSISGTMRIDTHGNGNVHETWLWVGDPDGNYFKVGFEIDDGLADRIWNITATRNGVDLGTAVVHVPNVASNTFSMSYSAGVVNIYGTSQLLLSVNASMAGIPGRVFVSMQNDIAGQNNAWALSAFSLTTSGFMSGYDGVTNASYPLNFTGIYYAELTAAGGQAGGATFVGGGGAGTVVTYGSTTDPLLSGAVTVQIDGYGPGNTAQLVETSQIAFNGDDGADGGAGGSGISAVDEFDGGNGAATKGGGGGSGTVSAAGGNASGQTGGTGQASGGAGSLAATGKNGAAPGGGGGAGLTYDAKGGEGQVLISPLIGELSVNGTSITLSAPYHVTWPGGTIPFTLAGSTTVTATGFSLSNGSGTLTFASIPVGAVTLKYNTSGKTPLKTAAGSDITGTMNVLARSVNGSGNSISQLLILGVL